MGKQETLRQAYSNTRSMPQVGGSEPILLRNPLVGLALGHPFPRATPGRGSGEAGRLSDTWPVC